MKKWEFTKRLLVKYRKKNDLSQKEISNRLGYSSAQFISNWERGLSAPPDEVLPLLCELLSIPPKSMLEAFVNDRAAILKRRLGL